MRGRIVKPAFGALRTPDDAIEVRADAVRLALAESMAGGAFLGRVLALVDRRAGQQLFDRLVGFRLRRLRRRRLCSVTATSKPGLAGLAGWNTASAPILSASRHRQVNSNAPRILLISKESIAASAPEGGKLSGIGAGAALDGADT